MSNATANAGIGLGHHAVYTCATGAGYTYLARRRP